MTTDNPLPFWTISSGGNDGALVPTGVFDDAIEGLTPQRLQRLRNVLAAYADDPPVILERHAIAKDAVPLGGRVLAASSPLLRSLQEVVGSTRAVTAVERSSGATEVLYRMVVPKQVAGQIAGGLARPMSAGGSDASIYSAIVGKAGIIANAKFVPVAAGGAAQGAAGGTVAATTVGAGVIAAAPMIVLLAATAATVYAEEQRRRALERLQTSLDDLKLEFLDKERDELNGAIGAISRATSILADEGRLGVSLGLDSAVHAIDTAVARAERRLQNWEKSLSRLGSSSTPKDLEREFEGIREDDGQFIAMVRMAGFAIAMKRRVAILQAAEHAQINTGLTLARFTHDLQLDTAALAEIEQRLVSVLRGIAELSIKAPSGVRDVMFRPGEVRELLAWAPRLKEIAARESPQLSTNNDIELSVVVHDDGSVRVLEPVAIRPLAS